MDISSIRAGASPNPAYAAQIALSRAPVATRKTPQPSDAPAPAPAPPPQKKSDLAPLDVRVETRPDGGHQLTIVDKTTGQIYCQLPPEQIVQVLEDALRRMQHGKGE